MRRTRPPVLTLILVLMAVPVPAVPSSDSDTVPNRLSREQMERFLLTAKIVRQKELSVGITNSRRVTLVDGSIRHDAHVQNVDIQRRQFKTDWGTENNFRDSYRYNIAAYLLDKLMDLTFIPVSVERRLEGRPAAFTWWVDDVMMTEQERVKKKIQPPDPSVWNGQMHVLRVFDQLICNTDRNLQNILITGDWNLWLIDHTRAFRPNVELREAKNLVRCDRRLLEGMRRLTEESLKRGLNGCLKAGEIRPLLARRDRIVAFFEAEIGKKGEAAILYDAVR